MLREVIEILQQQFLMSCRFEAGIALEQSLCCFQPTQSLLFATLIVFHCINLYFRILTDAFPPKSLQNETQRKYLECIIKTVMGESSRQAKTVLLCLQFDESVLL